MERALLTSWPYQNRKWLEKQYLTLKRSILEIANECGSNTFTIKNWLKRFSITTRSISEGRLVNQNHVTLSKEASEFINGELLGDGHLSLNKHSAVYAHTSKYKEYPVFLSEELARFGIEQVGKIYKKRRFTRFPSRYAWGTTFYYCSRAYPELKDLHSKWYRRPTAEELKKDPWRKYMKKLPFDLNLTPLVCRQWYIGDGHLFSNPRSNCIELSTQGFTVSEVNLLTGKLKELSFTATKQKDNGIRISTKSTPDFLNYIGPCPIKCYEYKWDGVKPF